MLVAACSSAPPGARPVTNEVPAKASEGPKFASFWKGRPQPASTPDCSDGQLEAAVQFAGTPAERASHWATLATLCNVWASTPTVTSLAGLESFATALMEAKYPNECVAVLSPIITPYADGLHVDAPDPRVEAVERLTALGERCNVAHQEARAAFAAGGFALVPEAGPAGSSCPTVVASARALTATEGPLTEEDFCCDLEAATSMQRDGWTYVRVTGGGRVCGGGTASRTLDAVYRVDKDRLVLEVDDSITWH